MAKKKKKKKKVVSTKVDKFGSYLDGNAASINKCLGKKPKAMKQLVKEAGLKSTFYNHLNKLVKKGLVKKTKNKYSIK